MKTFKKLISEVAQPKPEDEKHFKEKHVVDKIPHPHADDTTFKGTTKKDKTRRADYETGQDEDVYEALDPVGKADADIDNDGDVDSSDKYLHARRKAISKAMKKRKMKEEADQLGEMKYSAIMKKINDGKWEAMTDVKQGKHVEVRDTETGKRKMVMVEKAESEAQAIAARIALKHKREGTKPEAGSASAEMMKMSEKDLEDFTKAKKGAPYKVNEDAWEEIPMMTRQLQFIMYAAQEIAEYLNECEEMCVDPEEWFQNKLAHVHGTMANLYTYIAGEKGMRMYGEEVEQLDELSPKTMHNYTKKAVKSLERNARKGGYSDKSGNYDMADAKYKTADKRMKGIATASKRLADKAMKEALQEAVNSGKLELDDGSSVSVSKQDADLLNQMLKDLNAQNRKMMEKTMMTDKAGFEEILGFAREAL